jgi:hypothetical protein
MPRGFGIFFFGGRKCTTNEHHLLLARHTMRCPCRTGIILNEQEVDIEITEKVEITKVGDWIVVGRQRKDETSMKIICFVIDASLSRVEI